MKYDVKSLKLADGGKKRIVWADNDMPVLQQVRQKFAKSQVLKGRKMSACLHVTAETEWLARCSAEWQRTGDKIISVKLVNTKPKAVKR